MFSSISHYCGTVLKALGRYCWSSRRASIVVEGACAICFLSLAAGIVFETVNGLLIGDVLDRAAYAVARDNSLQGRAADDTADLLLRAKAAIRAELRYMIDLDHLRIQIDVYDNPSAMLRGELSTGANSALGGDSGDMVVVRMGFAPFTPLARVQALLGIDDFPFRTVAVVRNEQMVGLGST